MSPILKVKGSNTPAIHSQISPPLEVQQQNVRSTQEYDKPAQPEKTESLTAETQNIPQDEVIHKESAKGLNIESTSNIQETNLIINKEDSQPKIVETKEESPLADPKRTETPIEQAPIETPME